MDVLTENGCLSSQPKFKLAIIPKIEHLKSPEGRSFLNLQEVDLHAHIRTDYSEYQYPEVHSKRSQKPFAIPKRSVNCQPYLYRKL